MQNMAVLETVAGIMELRIYGITELRIYGTTDRAKPAQGFALLRRTTRQLVGAAAGIIELRSHGITDRAKPAQGSQLVDFLPFSTL